jgi:hypothetical protein
MLSLILSRIFSICFIIALLCGAIAVGTQLTDGRPGIHLSNGWKIGFLQKGLEVEARGSNQRALPADTVLKFEYRDSNNNIIGGGMRAVGSPLSLRELQRAGAIRVKMDTFYRVMGQGITGDINGTEYSVDETARANTGFLPDSGIISRNPLVFADAPSANRYFLLRNYSFRNKISGTTVSTQTLRIQPADQWQRMCFAFHELVKFASISLLFLFLSRLFSNFNKHHFFTPVNIRLLRNTGWLMLVPTVVSALLYFLVLRHITPVEFVMDQNAGISSMINYNLLPGLNWLLITVGMGLLVLAYIFHDGLELKKDTQLII